MAAPLRDAALLQHLEVLLDAPDATSRARVLLDAALGLGGAAAGAVWRRVDAHRGARGQPWRPVLERGPADALPARGIVAQLLQGGARWSPPGGAQLLHPKSAAWALVLGEAHGAREDDLDRLEALLVVADALEQHAALAPGDELLEGQASPLPPAREGEAQDGAPGVPGRASAPAPRSPPSPGDPSGMG